MKHIKTIYIVLTIAICCMTATHAQDKEKPHISLKDSLDGAFDMSDYLIYANGFIVVPVPLTEPALGGIGGALVPVFIKKRAPYKDEKTGKVRRVNPDVTGAIGMYTANDSWMAGGFRMGTFAKQGIMYRAFAGYASMNLSLYHTFPDVGEKEFEFHFDGIPIYLQVLKQFRNEKWSLGPQYLFLKTEVSLPGEDLPDFIKDKEAKNITSQLGLALQFDGRDNIFTPDKGTRVQLDFLCSDNIFGSDYDAWRINYSAIGFMPITKKLIVGLRMEGSDTFGETPFFLKPSINLRGIAGGRYQANNTWQGETEFRWDAYRRWSAVFFGGIGVAFDDFNEIADQQFKPAYGTGFRYLIARKFKLRMGVDVAKGPDNWAYYIVFGSNWMR
jgi:hypothetical protein